MPLILHENDDPIMRLFVHYFCPADLMYRQYQKLQFECDKKSKLSKRKNLDMLSYLYFWLSSLCVVYEGFTEEEIQNGFVPWRNVNNMINIHCDSISYQYTQIGKELKLFRNATFHFQPSADKHLKFLLLERARNPITWAVAFHNELKMLFSKYRIERTVHYILQDDNEDYLCTQGRNIESSFSK